VRFAYLFLAMVLLLTGANGASAQAYPDTRYSSDIPTLEEIVGHATGEGITSVAEIHDYVRALAEAAPDHMEVRSYGESWQGRELIYAVIASPENMKRLDEIQADLAEVGQGAAPAEDLPAVVWLSYGVHGDEITPPDSALFMAYHLLAAEDDELVETILANIIIIIDPSQNPDGRERFIHSFTSALGLEAQADRHTAEHDQPWPRGRFNHYIFDLNRDWFVLTQPETIGKVQALLDWHPVVFVDAHEMGGDATYYFPPAARPFNPNITEAQRSNQVQLGQNMARYFDAFGVPYFTREVFDAFYPGYGDMWPTLNGATAMTFEQGSPRGLVFKRRDGTELTYAEGVRNNVLSSLATLETVARNKDDYLEGYAAYRRSAIEEGRRADDRFVVIDLSKGRYEAETLARTLARQGLRVQRAEAGVRACGRRYPSGAIIVDLAQPQGRLARTLLSLDTPLAEDFIAEQESRRERGLSPELYDVTAWSMPLMFGLSSEMCARVDAAGLNGVEADDLIPAMIAGDASFGYIIPWTDSGQAKLVIEALKSGLTGKTTDKAFTRAGRTFPSGSVVMTLADNSPELGAELSRLSREIGAEFVAMDSSWVDDGPNFGSSSFAALKMPRIALAWGEGTSPTSAGNMRFVLERQLGLPVANIKVATMGRADLEDYDVVILPDTYGRLADRFGNLTPLADYVRGGGVLIAVDGALAELAGDETSLVSTEREKAFVDLEAPENGDEDASRVPGLIFGSAQEYDAYIHDHDASPDDIPGVLVNVSANTDHWLAAGYEDAVALVTGRDIYRPLNEGDGSNVFRFASADDLLASGYLWEENRLQLAYKPFVVAERSGRGVTIGFTQDPTTRAYLNGLNLLIANAVVLGPARMAR